MLFALDEKEEDVEDDDDVDEEIVLSDMSQAAGALTCAVSNGLYPPGRSIAELAPTSDAL